MDSDWSEHDKYPKNAVECVNGHHFNSHSKFDGYRISIVSRELCPECGTDELRACSTLESNMEIKNENKP